MSLLYLAFFFIAVAKSSQLTVNNISNPWPRSISDNRVRIITQSCNYQYYEPNTLWSYMVSSEPDLVTLLGDTIYLDAKPCDDDKENCEVMLDNACTISHCYKAKDISCFNYCWSATKWYTNPFDEYDVLLNSSQFTLNKQYDDYPSWPVPVIAIWDDHDYCKDNSNATCAYKNLTKDAFIYFLNEVDQTQSFTKQLDEISKTDRGIYYYYDFNKTLKNNNGTNVLKIRFYNFDVRWYRTKKEILGQQQQSWFEDLLFNTDIDDIDYHIVCTGSVYYPTFGLGEYFAEPWPTKSKEWFYNVTSRANIRDRLIILSGDVHYSAIYRDNQTFEIVTSAMTHGIYTLQAEYLQHVQEDDGYLVTDIINTENIGILDLGENGFEFIYINDKGEILVNFTYSYNDDQVYYENNEDAGFRFLNVNWILVFAIYLIYLTIV